jgi:hypothetical protein
MGNIFLTGKTCATSPTIPPAINTSDTHPSRRSGPVRDATDLLDGFDPIDCLQGFVEAIALNSLS